MDILLIILGIIGIVVRNKGRKVKSKDMEWIGNTLALASFTVLAVMWVRNSMADIKNSLGGISK